eukprot:TRINITY_DN12485_c0_g2_i1.p1 TRINITY_DN12485_c0_g2~~TRINITY_DN12485_c0_g2_i1.p1  ORF type:complete len:564 (-),score=59.87 TRINITY_DN12485_c0_g2_i1:245-1936(-)
MPARSICNGGLNTPIAWNHNNNVEDSCDPDGDGTSCDDNWSQSLHACTHSLASSIETHCSRILAIIEHQRVCLELERTELKKEREKFDINRFKVEAHLGDAKDRIVLNVGGVHHHTTVSTLKQADGSMLQAMFSGRFSLDSDEDGSYFLDRDGTLFRYVLDFLRTGEFESPENPSLLERLSEEADFYCLPQFKHKISVAHGKWWAQTHTQLLHDLQGHHDYVLAVVIVDNCVVSGSADGTIICWDINSGKLIRHLFGHTDYVATLDVSHIGDEYYIFSGSRDKTIRCWDITTEPALQYQLTGHTDYVQCLQAVSADCLVSGGQDGTIVVWDLQQRNLRRAIQAGDAVKCLCANEEHIIAGISTCVKIFDLHKGTCLKILHGHEGVIRSIVHCSTLNLIVTGAWNNQIILWDYFKDSKEFTLDCNSSMDEDTLSITTTHSPATSPSSKSNSSPTSASLSTTQASPSKTVTSAQGTTSAPSKTKEGNRMRILNGHTGWISGLHIVGGTLFSSSGDKTIRMWDLNACRLMHTIETNHTDFVRCFAVDQKNFVTGSFDKSLKVWGPR